MPGLRALLVALGTLLTVGAAVVLRADSAGPLPHPAVLGALAAATALAQWLLLAHQRCVPTLLGGLLLTQLGLQLALQALGTAGGGGLSDVLCCPPVPTGQGAGALGLLTAQAGLGLLLVQLVAAGVTALSVRSVQVVAVDTLRRAAASLRQQVPLLVRLLAALGADDRPVPPVAPAPPRRDDDLLPLLDLTTARSVTRRGPPRRDPRPPSSPSRLHACGVAVS